MYIDVCSSAFVFTHLVALSTAIVHLAFLPNGHFFFLCCIALFFYVVFDVV